ncbi:MAG: YkgJ family cysteine cluster protein [Methanoregula sp.]|uniref:YkgJ family cysteine cluster protein n=1 Tax=Methanoregula sp. TaxID=2052170 RepID=UPI003C4CEAC4
MAFRCQQCGDCCIYMGDIIGIEDRIDPVMFRIRFSATGEERMVTLDPDKVDFFRSQDIRYIHPMACPFLRFRDPKQACCTVHNSRPDLCRIYTCFRLLILDPDGNHIGRVQDGSHIFSMMNNVLRELWQDEIAGGWIFPTKLHGKHMWQTFFPGPGTGS